MDAYIFHLFMFNAFYPDNYRESHQPYKVILAGVTGLMFYV